MSEREFETYLTLLCRLLRLDADQREAIAGELRDHLEERLTELKSLGVAHDEAVRLALDEFGDAAGLASEFSSIARNMKRRRFMRITVGSTIAAAVAAMAAMALWPEAQPGPAPATAVAQAPQAPKPAEGLAPQPGASAQSAPASAAPLERRLSADFIEVPLRDVLDFIADAADVQLYTNEKRLAAAEISVDSPITIQLRNVRVDMLLDLTLAQASEQLAYVMQDGIILVSTQDDLEGAAEVRIYNVRDLLKLPDASHVQAMSGMAGGYGGMSLGGPGYGEGSMEGGGYGMGMMSGAAAPSRDDRAETLVQVIRTAVGRGAWREQGDYGTIAIYEGLLVVNHNTRVHQQVERLLDMMRSAARAEGQP
jgi:hypothetical protein